MILAVNSKSCTIQHVSNCLCNERLATIIINCLDALNASDGQVMQIV